MEAACLSSACEAQTGNATGLANGVTRPGTPRGCGGGRRRGLSALREAAARSGEARPGPARPGGGGAARGRAPPRARAPRAAAGPGLNLFPPEPVAGSPATPRGFGCCLKWGLRLGLRLPASHGRGEGPGTMATGQPPVRGA